MMFWQRVVTIGIAAVTNFLTRYLPFRLFTSSKDEEDELSPFIKGLGEFLPAAIMSMLVVYCYRNINLLGGNHGLPDLIAGLITVLVHLWRRSMFLSLIVGTVSYILLINFVF
ncbi:branched-chain amino acid transporter permease [Limosilactobacillus sp.]|jgi:branched-subunit amino acid transport protein AzlD|uniref:branched-chain amino acid transporter permease n=1 Tax=Limosilactobacillus sp. TaxID=2773925 RepID=UPI0025BD2CA8|nr:AzlD domain-containing protein [Limosilactobacillus sp.]MCH3922737.1 AzlD domain-containing protein [Limosilactobacillus sp.]MCH3927420.1 AzlD domain-containing protein [Limosilactobacillus sp.]